MFTGAVSPVETVNAENKSLSTILKEVLPRGFTGYIAYINELEEASVYIAIINGKISACRSLFKNSIQEGFKCVETASKYLDAGKGVIEIYESNPDLVSRDILLYPLSMLKENQELRTRLQLEAVKPLAPEVPATRGLRETIDIPVSDECLDPVTLYSIIKSSKLLEIHREPITIREVARKIRSTAETMKPVYVYVSGEAGGTLIRIIYSAQTNSLNIEVEGESEHICGKQALEKIIKELIASTKIWIK